MHTSESVKHPVIEYHPDYAEYLQQSARRLAENPSLLDISLPFGFPGRVEGPIIWEGKDWQGEHQWVYQMNDAELEEIDGALQYFKGALLESLLSFAFEYCSTKVVQ